jgi:phosphopantothenoylcysteine decarboxylase/phosphopantothenate--cysteine ligase
LEPIDPVRFISNYSSGKQGIAIAKRFYELGADVKLIAANIDNADIELPKVAIINVKTADEMLKAVEKNLAKTAIFVACAAVADFKVKKVATEKIKKTEKNHLTLELIKNVDILKTIANHKQRPKLVVGFAAESENLIVNAKKKLKEKNCDFIVANNIKTSEVFGSNYNQISLIDKKGKVENFEKMTKSEVASLLVEKLFRC